METNKKAVGIIVSVVVVLGVISATVFLGRKTTDMSVTDQNQTAPTETPKTPVQAPSDKPKVIQTPPPVTVPKKSTSVYKDGSYSATGSYMSPGGLDHLGLTLTLKDDLITDVTVTPQPGDNTSARYQDKFVSGYKVYVLGKNISDVQISKVSGSSLTSIGFNDALTQIKSQAKV